MSKLYMIYWHLKPKYFNDYPTWSRIYKAGPNHYFTRRADIKNKAKAKKHFLKKYSDLKEYIVIDAIKVNMERDFK